MPHGRARAARASLLNTGAWRALSSDAPSADDVPVEQTRVVIKEVPADARSEVFDGKRYLRGRTLASYLEEFDGFEGEVRQPMTGRLFAISLEEWRGRDPESAWLDMMFVTDP